MTYEETEKFIAHIIREELVSKGFEVKQIVLFGSQSRGSAEPHSDWDFLVSITEELNFREKASIITIIQRRLAQKHISVDIILKSERKISQEKNNIGVITFYALKEGVPV